MSVKTIQKTFFLILIVLAGAHSGFSQQLEKKYNELYLKGLYLFEKGMYSDAETVFFRAVKETDPTDVLTLSDIAYHRSICALKLKLPNLESYVEYFCGNYPEHKNINNVTFELANYFFAEKDYKKAIFWYEKVDSRALRYYQHVECTFKKGYTYFELHNLNKAERCFVEIKDVTNSPYSAPATYYYGHVEYQKGHYVSAQLAFENVMNDDRFAAQAPFYLVHIYYLQEAYRDVIRIGVDLLPAMTAPYNAETARIIAESFFHTKDYEKAREYFSIYATSDDVEISRPDDYFLAVLNYHTKDYETAIDYLGKVSKNQKDSLAQNALYYLGSTYLILNKKDDAQKAFREAGKLNRIASITKDAKLQYAKLALELQDNGEPLKKYFEEHTVSDKDAEMKNYLASLYITKKDFEKALEELYLVAAPTDKQRADMQRLNFIIGKKLYDTKDASKYERAINHFEAAIRSAGYDANIAALSKYYKADAFFTLGYYAEAQKQFEDFTNSSGAIQSNGEYIAAQYNIGYCFFKMNAYNNAITWFRKFITAAGNAYQAQVADAYNRLGDCNYIQSKYWPAAENYEKAESMKVSNPDYAMYQRAISYGLVKRNDRKTATLTSLIQTYPKSSYAAGSLLELGRTYLQDNKYSDAETAFMQIVNNYPESGNTLTHAMIELGLIYMNTNRLNDAVAIYKKAQHQAQPGSDDEKSALVGLQNAYLDLGTPTMYYDYLEEIGKEANRDEREQAIYNAAEKLANSGYCEKAIGEFKKFTADYPNSSYLPQAYFYLANCYSQSKDYISALDGYKYTIEHTNNNAYKEQALVRAAQINNMLGSDEAALAHLKMLVELTENNATKLSAFMDMARIHANKLHNYKEAANTAQSALLMAGITPQQVREMNIIKANSWRELGQQEAALELYKEIVAANLNDRENAEANFHIIDYTFKNDDFTDESAKRALDFVNSKAKIYQYWNARTFIILAEQYAKHGNVAQAEAIYNSILSGYKNTTDGIIDSVKQHLDSLKK